MVLTDQFLIGVLSILAIVVFASFTFSFMVMQWNTLAIDKIKDELSISKEGLQRFELKQQEHYYELKASFEPFIEAFREARKVKEARIMETFLEGDNPWTARESELKLKFYKAADSLTQSELLELIQAFDRHLDNHEFGRLDGMKAMVVLECLSSRLREQKARERIYQETPRFLRSVTKAITDE